MKYIVIGDSIIDVWMTAKADRRSAEADIPIYDIEHLRMIPGGAANVARALRHLNVPVEHQFDFFGPYPHKNRIVVDGRQVCRYDERDYCQVAEWDKSLQPATLIVSDYGKGAINAGVIKDVYNQGRYIWINAKTISPDYWCLDMDGKSGCATDPIVTWTCNQSEYEAAKDWYDRQENVFVTKGAEGMSRRRFGREEETWKAEAKQVVSVCGAGDVTFAALIAASEYNLLPRFQGKFAMTAAAIAVERPYTYCPLLAEIEDRINYAEN